MSDKVCKEAIKCRKDSGLCVINRIKEGWVFYSLHTERAFPKVETKK